MPKRKQVGTKIDSNIDVNLGRRVFENRALTAAGARCLKFGGSNLALKVHQQIDKTRSPRWNASWPHFFTMMLDFRRQVGSTLVLKINQKSNTRAWARVAAIFEYIYIYIFFFFQIFT